MNFEETIANIMAEFTLRLYEYAASRYNDSPFWAWVVSIFQELLPG